LIIKKETPMSLFDLRQLIMEEYGKYVQSFFSIAEERVREFIKEGVLSPG